MAQSEMHKNNTQIFNAKEISSGSNLENKQSIKEKYTSTRNVKNGVSVVLRPIDCDDKARFKDFFESLSLVSIHFRFFEMIKELPNETVEKYCNLDYSKELAIVALPKDEDRIVAVARLGIEAEQHRGEFALVVADSWQGKGLGSELLDYLIEIARDYRLVQFHFFVSADNTRMISLAKKAGMRVKSSEGDILEMAISLNGSDADRMA